MASRKVKIIVSESPEDLERDVNEFFDIVGDSINLIDVKYELIHTSINVDSETRVYPECKYSAMVIYSV